MFFGVIGGLFVGWILTLFGFGGFMINGLTEFGLYITMTGYYIIFATIGLLSGAFGQRSN